MTPVTEREIGALEQKISNLEHRSRNDKTILNNLLEEIDLVRLDLNQFKGRVYGVCSVLVILFSSLAWIIEFVNGD